MSRIMLDRSISPTNGQPHAAPTNGRHSTGAAGLDPHPRYQILEKIGSGSFATVYRGHDRELGRDVAIKQIHAQYLEDPHQLDRYWQEAQLLASFQHPNIVTIFDLVRPRGWLILELMQTNLSKIAGKKPLDLESLRSTLAHCLRALKFLHAHGVLHGDIKPGNLMIDRRKRIKIGDFGLARRVSDEEGSLLKGTTKYMAPELISDDYGEVGPASDLYSLGFSAYELMCGENFESLFPGLGAFGRDRQIAWMMWHAAPDRRLPEIARVLEGVPADLAHVIQKLTAKNPAERYQTADQALIDLGVDNKTGLHQLSTEADSAAESASKPNKNRPLLIGAAVMSVLLSLAMLFLPSGQAPVGPQAEVVETRGLVRELKLAEGVLVVEDVDGVPSELVLGEKPRIRLNDEKFVLLKEIREGDLVELRESGGTRLLLVQRPVESRGKIQTVSVPEKQLVVLVETATVPEAVTLAVTSRSKLVLNGKQASLAELREEDRLSLVHVKGPEGRLARDLIRLEALRTRELVGYVAEIDRDKRRLTLTGRLPGEPGPVVDWAEDCKVTINGEAVGNSQAYSPADLQISDRLKLRLDLVASQIDAVRGTRLSGAIQEVSESAEEIIVRSDDIARTSPITLTVSPQTVLTLGQVEAVGTDFRKFDRVDAIYAPLESDRGRAMAIDATRPQRQDRLVLLFANQNYDDRRLSRLTTPLESCRRLEGTLISRYGVNPERSRLVADATREQWLAAFDETLSKVSNLTQLIVCVAGHAYVDGNDVWIAPRNANWDDLPKTGVSLSEVLTRLDQCAARERLLLLDCARGGEGQDLARQPSTQEMVDRLRQAGGVPLKKLAILVSSLKGQTGLPSTDGQADAFLDAVSLGYRGGADRNRDLEITPRELFEFTQTELANLPEGAKQAPGLILP
jgi:eukaryotic-like serine/threonine-protein kinase